jgi:hypothetical protein
MSESTRKSLMLSLFIGALVNSMLSSRQKHHSKPPRSYRISRLANSVRAPLGVDLGLVSFCTGRTKYVSSLRDPSRVRGIFLEWPEETHASECSTPCSRVMCGQDPSRPTQDSNRQGIDLRPICQPSSFCRICLRCLVCTKDSLCCTSSLPCCVLSRYHIIK